MLTVRCWRGLHLITSATVLAVVAAFSIGVADVVAADGEGLLKTQWYQDGPFAQFTPRRERVGCWSTAYAQILFYHRLKPTGRVRYECASGDKVDVDLDSLRFDFDRFANEVTENTAKAELEEIARYSFATAVVVRKDFGTGGYKRLLNSVGDLETHFGVDAEIYVSLGEKLPISRDEVEAKLRSEKITNLISGDRIVALLTTELEARRPVYFHFGNIKDFGHSTVIDGIRKEGGRQMVHINFGSEERERTKWYELFAPISQADDMTLRAFVTIKPDASAARGSSTPARN